MQIYIFICSSLLQYWQYLVLTCSCFKFTIVSLFPTFGGSNPGLRAELIHSVKEQLSLICGCAFTTHPSAFASVAVSNFWLFFASESYLISCKSLKICFFPWSQIKYKRCQWKYNKCTTKSCFFLFFIFSGEWNRYLPQLFFIFKFNHLLLPLVLKIPVFVSCPTVCAIPIHRQETQEPSYKPSSCLDTYEAQVLSSFKLGNRTPQMPPLPTQ